MVDSHMIQSIKKRYGPGLYRFYHIVSDCPQISVHLHGQDIWSFCIKEYQQDHDRQNRLEESKSQIGLVHFRSLAP